MQNPDYSIQLDTFRTSNEVFAAINDVPSWWTENFEGDSKKPGGEFTVSFGETYIGLKVAELVNNYKIVWEVADCHKHFLKNKKEWVGTKIVFDIMDSGNEGSKLTFTHEGLISPLECYDICCDAWNGYLQGSLKKLVESGKGTPDRKV